MYTHPYGRGETCVYLSWTVRCIHIHMAGERHVFIYHELYFRMDHMLHTIHPLVVLIGIINSPENASKLINSYNRVPTDRENRGEI